MANFYSAMAYPGSPLYAQARKDELSYQRHMQDIVSTLMKTLNLRIMLTASAILRFRDTVQFLSYERSI